MNPQLITSLTHSNVKRWVRLREEASERVQEKSVLIQGKKVVTELAAHSTLQSLIVTEAIHRSYYPYAHETFVVTEEIMKKVTGVPHPEGIAAVVDLPQETNLSCCSWILALDGVSDPGNVGTLVRTAYALGWEGIYLLPGSCDLYNDKALRASMGATFHMKYQSGSHEELLKLQESSRISFYRADLIGISVESLTSCQRPLEKALLVMGSESHGVSPQICLKSQAITIPMHEDIDSLNVAVAGGIMLYMLRKGCNHGMG